MLGETARPNTADSPGTGNKAEGDGVNAPEASTKKLLGVRARRGLPGCTQNAGRHGETRQELGRPKRFLTRRPGRGQWMPGERIDSHRRGNPETEVGHHLGSAYAGAPLASDTPACLEGYGAAQPGQAP